MKRLTLLAALAALTMTTGIAGGAEPDWSKVTPVKFTVFYPGVTPMAWMTKRADHDGSRGLSKGETCAGCHDEEAADVGKSVFGNPKLEPAAVKGRATSIQVNAQAAHDGTNLYLRFSWKQPPPTGAAKRDAENQAKLSIMLDDGRVETADLAGCWASCHGDVRTMPGVADDTKTKYVKGGSLQAGVFYDLMQWTSKGKAVDGHVAERRVMGDGKGLVSATGKLAGDTWTVTFVRKLAAGGPGDIALAPGKTYNFGFSIHDDFTDGRFHLVSLGYTLGIGAKADLTAGKH